MCLNAYYNYNQNENELELDLLTEIKDFGLENWQKKVKDEMEETKELPDKENKKTI